MHDFPTLAGGHSKRLAAHQVKMGRDTPKAATASPTPAAPPKQASATVSPNPGAVFGYLYRKSDLDAAAAKAAAQAVTQERARIAAVYASDASQGRERVCATLLTSSKGFTAAAIVANLGTLTLDRELAAQDPEARAQGDAAWERAYASTRTPVASGSNAAPDASDPWARAYAAAPTSPR